ncbi:unnamed protein product [Clonostachys rhizophaga]|uniref:Nephrocystin 3-like N-terminal domain-containing protein n=1 Tax=Clonostachys rhizophaga TaxID=160324 RepID=A0A9N9YHZ4_9HYPO|nr:unnamed protein product [Clonostachys rhizophaga]
MGTSITTIVTQSTFGDDATIVGSVTNNLSSDLLPTAGDATYDSYGEQHNPTCLTNTRTQLLHQIQQWVKSPTSESIFWLNGMAGTGKSTIARTMAKWLRETEVRNTGDGSTRLSASFFFKEGNRNRGHARFFFTTIASQLETLDADLGSLIASAIRADPGIKDKALKVQFNKLIKQPLRDAQKPMIITIVVDAMDECDECNDAKLIIDLLPQLSKIPSFTIRAFLTSRPELPIRLGFKDLTCKYHEIGLHEISRFLIEKDLTTFFSHALGRIRDEQNKICWPGDKLQPDWPGPEKIRLLVGMASPLFIFASTICRFIGSNGGSPEEQLDKILAC